MQCEKCEKLHDGKFGSGRFCSRSCSNSRPKPDELRKRVSNTLKGKTGHSNNKGKHLVPRVTKNCTKCGEEFIATPKCSKKICGRKCLGGYREGSGRAKTGYYKGIYCGSTYELVWVIYMLDHGLPFSRFDGYLENNEIRYYPDFIIDKTIYEIKGFEAQEIVDKKTQLAKSLGYQVVLLHKDDLEKQFDWVKTNYEYKNVYELYDGHKPKYNYICSYCQKCYNSDTCKDTMKHNFCSRICAGHARKNSNLQKKIEVGKCNYVRRFTKEQALYIYNSNNPTSELMKEFNISKNAICSIKAKKSYKWIH